MNKRVQKQYSAKLAKALAALCVRNTFLEDLHAGKVPSSETGDYSDVKVVTPYGEIPWNELSRLSDAEMKTLMKEVVNKLYTALMSLGDDEAMRILFINGEAYAGHWDEPELIRNFLKHALLK